MSVQARPGGRAPAVAFAAIALLLMLAVVVAFAPANWLAREVASRTGGHLLLADADGTVWSGSAVLAIGGVGGASDRLALPGRVTWTLEFARFLAPVIHLKQDAVLRQPIDVRVVDGGLEVGAGSASLPASLLRLAGAPMNTLRPDGRCEVDWGPLRQSGGAWAGSGALRVLSLSVAISPVRPLGDYAATWVVGREGLDWTLATERGPLELRGAGRWAGRSVQARVVARVAAGTPVPVAARVVPLLDAIGRRSEGEAVFELGPR